MKREQKEKIIEKAQDLKSTAAVIEGVAAVTESLDSYWVQAWIEVPKNTVETD